MQKSSFGGVRRIVFEKAKNSFLGFRAVEANGHEGLGMRFRFRVDERRDKKLKKELLTVKVTRRMRR